MSDSNKSISLRHTQELMRYFSMLIRERAANKLRNFVDFGSRLDNAKPDSRDSLRVLVEADKEIAVATLEISEAARLLAEEVITLDIKASDPLFLVHSPVSSALSDASKSSIVSLLRSIKSTEELTPELVENLNKEINYAEQDIIRTHSTADSELYHYMFAGGDTTDVGDKDNDKQKQLLTQISQLETEKGRLRRSRNALLFLVVAACGFALLFPDSIGLERQSVVGVVAAVVIYYWILTRI